MFPDTHVTLTVTVKVFGGHCLSNTIIHYSFDIYYNADNNKAKTTTPPHRHTSVGGLTESCISDYRDKNHTHLCVANPISISVKETQVYEDCTTLQRCTPEPAVKHRQIMELRLWLSNVPRGSGSAGALLSSHPHPHPHHSIQS